MKIQIINGPNINLLGKREPGIYGNLSFDDYLAALRQQYPQVEIAYYQSNCEGNLIDKLHEEMLTCDPFKIVAQMKVIVPEFKSNNSIFSKLDK